MTGYQRTGRLATKLYRNGTKLATGSLVVVCPHSRFGVIRMNRYQAS